MFVHVSTQYRDIKDVPIMEKKYSSDAAQHCTNEYLYTHLYIVYRSINPATETTPHETPEDIPYLFMVPCMIFVIN